MQSSPPSVHADDTLTGRVLPPDDLQRMVLHQEVHARPSPQVHLPALITYVAVLNEEVSLAQELAQLQALPGQSGLTLEQLSGHFLYLQLDGFSLKWERHSEFSRYSLIQALPDGAGLSNQEPGLLQALPLSPAWFQAIPGRTFCAMQLVMVTADLADTQQVLAQGQAWFGGAPILGSSMGNPSLATGGEASSLGHSLALTRFHVSDDGFERMLVVAPPHTSQTRAGRVAQRLVELETYRLMALRGLPVAKSLSPLLAQAEVQLADITQQLENKLTGDRALLDVLVALAASIERATAQHMYRFSATSAYHALVNQRIAELREKPISGTQTMGEFMQRRLSPAMATVTATRQRLNSLSERIARTSDLLRTRVNIATEEQNRQLLERLTHGQALQLRLQSTVEGLSLAAISYYVISLLLYAGKAAKAAGLPVNPELLAGASVPLVLLGVWKMIARIHHKLHRDIRSD
jgi:uncharacterized membrane-anchored protein